MQDTIQEVYNPYNLYNLSLQFKLFLINLKKSNVTLKNYLSDLRHFLGWIITSIKTESDSLQIDDVNLVTEISNVSIKQYRNYLLQQNTPRKTINRRLSTIRMFCTFCLNQGWMTENPSNEISNITAQSDDKKEIITQRDNSDLARYSSDYKLENELIHEDTQTSDDIQDFTNFISNK